MIRATEADRRLFIQLFHIPERHHAEVLAGCKDEMDEMIAIARHRLSSEQETIERCLGAVEQAKRDFLSEEYAFPQPIGSLRERFACDQIATAIRTLREDTRNDR